MVTLLKMMMIIVIRRRIITGLRRVVVKIADSYTLNLTRFEPRPANMYDGHVHFLLAEGQVFFPGFGFCL